MTEKLQFRVLDREIGARAISKWGLVPQLDQLQEECAEVITSVNHWKRKRDGAREELIEELADALICMDQIMDGLEIRDGVREAVAFKTERLCARLQGSKDV